MTANQTAFSRYCWGRSWHWTALRFHNCRWWALFTSQSVTLSLSFHSFTECSNLSTQTKGFWVLVHGAEDPGSESLWKWWSGGWDCPMNISGHFIYFYPLKKPNLSLIWHGPPLVVFSLSTLASKWAAVTLTLCTQHCVPVSHLHVPHQNSTSTHFSTAYEMPSCLT